MFRNYISESEFYVFHEVQDLIPPDRLKSALNAAGMQVLQDLISRGDTPRGYQVPVPLVKGQANYERETYTTDTEGEPVYGLNSGRLVVESDTMPDDAVVTLEGSNNASSASPVWLPVYDVHDTPVRILVDNDGMQSRLFLTNYFNYRFQLKTSSECVLAIYLVDAQPDELIRWKTIELALVDIIDDDNSRVGMMLSKAEEKYRYSLDNIRPDYDLSGDGVLTANEEATRNELTAYR